MFIDLVKIHLKAGDGGNGMVSFRKEKYIEKGGPFGGDGGDGGSIIFIVDEGLRTLMDFRYQQHFKGKRGEHGKSKAMHGRNAEDMYLKVPPGTIVYNDTTGDMLADLVHHEDTFIIAKGGRGGKGNIHFASSANPAPRISENGLPGEELDVRLELKLLADVGLVGLPSVGKSTLLSLTSNATPKIAAYHFTTLKPKLGVVDSPIGGFVMADLPGLIEGAAEGQGLGIQFLRHIERTKVIVHVLDMSGMEGRDPYEDYLTIREELKKYGHNLENRLEIIVANKMDLPSAHLYLEAFKQKISKDIFPISTVTGEGVSQLVEEISRKVQALEAQELREPQEEKKETYRVYRFEAPEEAVYVEYDSFHDEYVVTGALIERQLLKTNFHQQEAAIRFARILKKLGVDDLLREKGARDGDSVRILEYIFEYQE